MIGGTAEAVEILRSRDLTVLVGAIGYWAFDNAVLWATFEAVGADVPISIVLMVTSSGSSAACSRCRVAWAASTAD